MPDFPIIDTHVHLWDINHIDYPWLHEHPSLNKNFLPEDFTKACGAVEVEKIIFLQAEATPAQSMQETQWVTELANTDPRIQGIVSRAALEQGETIRPAIETLTQNSLVKGIRRLIQPEENIEFCIQPDFVKGVQLLPDYGLHFECCILHHQLANTIKLVAQCPNVTFNLNHIGKPDIKNHLLDPWRSELRELAAFENVTCKLSGLATEADHENWTPQDLQPYIYHVLDCFGFDRTFYGGDWPVSTLATPYPRWIATLEQALSGCSHDELKNLFVNNANTFYRLS